MIVNGRITGSIFRRRRICHTILYPMAGAVLAAIAAGGTVRSDLLGRAYSQQTVALAATPNPTLSVWRRQDMPPLCGLAGDPIKLACL